MAMYLRRCGPGKSERDHLYWELVESYRTERGPRQRIVAYLGDLDQAARLGLKQAALHQQDWFQSDLLDRELEAEWVEVDTKWTAPLGPDHRGESGSVGSSCILRAELKGEEGWRPGITVES